MMKKRTELEEKVMNIGLDVNLVRNMADLVPNNKYIWYWMDNMFIILFQ